MKKFFFFAFLLPLAFCAQAPAGYYNGTAGLTGYELKSKIHEIISSKNYNWNYGDLGNYYKQTDLDVYYDHSPANNPSGGNFILLDIYSEIPTGADAYEYNSTQLVGSSSAEGSGYNREHVVPQSTFYSNFPMYSDLHFVIPTDARINQLRGNYPYGIGTSSGSGVFYTFTNGSKIANDLTPNYAYTGRVYEPIDEFKGDVARAILYFVTRYESKLPSFKFEQYATSSTAQIPANDRSPLDGTQERALDLSYINMLKQWSANDPVSQREIDRNNAVFAIQKNRNPFVDNPGWVDLIWSENPDAIAPAAPLNLTLAQQNAYFVNLTWSPSTEPDVLGYKIFMNGSATPVAITKSNSISVDRLLPATSYSFSVKAYDKGYLESPDSNVVNAMTLATDGFAKDLMVTKYLEGTGNNKAIEISNKTGHEVNLNNYNLSIQFYNSVNGNYYFSEAYQLEGKVADGETFVVLNPNANFSCFTNAQAKFVTASDPLTFTGSNYVELSYNGNITVDAIGVKGVSNSLANQSLYRYSAVNQPNTVFDGSEWQVLGSDFCSGLGTLSVEDTFAVKTDIGVYPNPVKDGILFISGDKLKDISSAVIFDVTGRVVKQVSKPFYKGGNTLEFANLPAGTYILKLDSQTFKILKK